MPSFLYTFSASSSAITPSKSKATLNSEAPSLSIILVLITLPAANFCFDAKSTSNLFVERNNEILNAGIYS